MNRLTASFAAGSSTVPAPAGEDFAEDGVELPPATADRYPVNPRTVVVLIGR